MLSDDLCVVSWRARPGSFVGLMTLYESNYVRLGWILPDLANIEGEHVSRVPGDVSLHLRVAERARFTTTLELSYVLEDHSGPIVTPDMQIRIYRDARLAEAASCTGWRRHSLPRHLRDQVRVLQNLDVFHHVLPAHSFEPTLEVAQRLAVLIEQRIQQLAPCRVGDRSDHVLHRRPQYVTSRLHVNT